MFNEIDETNLQLHLFEDITRIILDTTVSKILSHVASQKIVRQVYDTGTTASDKSAKR